MKRITLTTTLKLLRAHAACVDGYRKLKKSLGAEWSDTRPINLLSILKSNGAQDTLWCLRATVENCEKVRCNIAADLAESVLHHFTEKYPDDDRPAKAIQAARDFANNKITAADAADATDAAYAAYAATHDADASSAAHAAYAAVDTTTDAAYDAYADMYELKKQVNIIKKYLA